MPRRRHVSSSKTMREFRKEREKRRRRWRERYSLLQPIEKRLREIIVKERFVTSNIRKLRLMLIERTLLERLGYRIPLLDVFRQWIMWLLKKMYYLGIYYLLDYFRAKSRKTDVMIMMSKLIIESLRGRATLVLRVEYYPFRDKEIIPYVVDNLLEQLPDEDKERLINMLVTIVKTKTIPPEILNDPLFQFFIRFYVMRYSPYPCRLNSIAIKVTPVIIKYTSMFFKTVSFLVLRFSLVRDLKPDIYLASPVFIDLNHYMTWRYKPWYELLTLRDYAGSGPLDNLTPLSFARDHLGRTTFFTNVESMMLRPSLVRRAYSHIHNMVEERYDINHCSLYFEPLMKAETKVMGLEADPRAIILVSKVKDWLKRRVLWS